MNNTFLKNFSSSAFGSIIGQLIGFIILLYLPRVLGPEGYGIFNFAQAYNVYFLLLSDLGLTLYCIREVNQKNSKEEIIKTVYNVKFYISLISTITFFVSVLVINKSPLEKYTLYCIGLAIFCSGISIEYIFNAVSNMKYIGIGAAIKNLIFLILCLLFIHKKNDVYLVSIFYSVSILCVVIFLKFAFTKRYFKLNVRRPKRSDFAILKRSMPLAIAIFMVQINNNFDIIYLSFTKTTIEVGFYSAAYRIINFLVGILVIYVNAAYPSIAELQLKGKKELSRFMKKYYSMGVIIVMPIVFGGLALSKKIIDFLFGINYYGSSIIFSILIPLVLIRLITGTYGSVLIMGKGNKFFTIGVVMGAIVNIILNVILVPQYSSIGSAYATIVSESIQGFYFYYYYKRYCNTKLIRLSCVPLIASVCMYILLKKLFYLNLFISILLGAIIYVVIIIIVYYLLYKLKNTKEMLV